MFDEDYKLNEIYARQLNALFNHDVEMFSSVRTHRLKCYVVPDEKEQQRADDCDEVCLVDAFVQDWCDYESIYMNPPFSQLEV